MLRQRIGVGVTALVLIGGIGVLGTGLGPWDPAEPFADADTPYAGVIITEFVPSNASIIADEDGDHSDWIELHNPTGVPISLAGFYLSDDDDQPDRWQLPEVTIGPDDYLVVWASGKDRAVAGRELHTNFRIARDGEPVMLTAPDGVTVLDRFEPVSVPRDASFGRDPEDPERTCYFTVPTPGEANAPECFADPGLGAPTLSATSGFYDEPFALRIDAVHDDATVIYTLDGSYPDLEGNAERTQVYDGPIRIEDRTDHPERIAAIDASLPSDAVAGNLPTPVPTFDEPIQKATVVRARTPYSAESAATYVVGDEVVREELPVLSLALDEEFLFDHDTGIYVAGRVFDEHRQSDDFDPDEEHVGDIPANYTQRGRAWERPFEDELHRAVVFEHCAPGGVCDHQRNVGVRVHGGASRSFQQKSLRLYARNDYSARTFEHPFFGDDAPVEQRRLILRNAGQEQRGTMLADAYLQSLMTHFEADTQAYQPAVVFINGEYWGIYNLRERYDRHYLHVTHATDPDETVAFEGGLRFDSDGRELLEFISDNDLSGPQALGQVEAAVDLDSFIDFVIANVYVGNSDWPGNNERLWREPDGPDAPGEGVRDGRWRWLIVDLDAVGRWGASDPDFNVWEHNVAPTDDPSAHGGLPLVFHRLMANVEVRGRFLTRFADHINTSFRPDRTERVLDEIVEAIEDEIPRHLQRWQTLTVEQWEGRIDQLRRFMRERPDRQRQHLVDLFDLDGTATVAIRTDTTQGVVRVNTVTIDPSTPGVDDASAWEGVYFRGVPVDVEAVAFDGHRFVGWQGLPDGAASDPQITLSLDDDVELTAVFEEE